MILKQKDDLTPHLAEIEQLLSIPSLTKNQRADLDDESWMIRAGAKGESEAAYHLDFEWGNALNSFVIHDLRIEHRGRVAQIDHLIVQRSLHCHVFESKGFGREVRISEAGEWETNTRYGWRGIPSPIEQNRRHIEVLKSYIADNGLGPKRLGFTMPMRFHNWVLVAPGCQLTRQGGEWDNVVKMDMFAKRFSEWIEKSSVADTIASLSKFISRNTLDELGQALLKAHRPAAFNFAAKFGIDRSEIFSPRPVQSVLAKVEAAEKIAAQGCQRCGKDLEQKVIDFCRINSKKFEGKLLCQTCQKVTPKPGCEGCGFELEDKVVAFCRFNSKRFNGRKLCRTCQPIAT
ncbi:MAG: hypothetical protein JWL59_4301 [Chthoniobacteraceae bacterium]|nr:hypothetical protein [Chthoniobacteraceae bacterium]